MTQAIISQEALNALVDAHALRGAVAVGTNGGWTVLFKYGITEAVLVTRNDKPRVFSAFKTLVEHLRKHGIVQFAVDAASYDPSAPRSEAGRIKAQRARARMKGLHQEYQRGELLDRTVAKPATKTARKPR